MSRRTNSHIYCPQQIRATSACFGLTQGDLESEHKPPFISSVFPIIFFLPIDLRLTCICVVIGTTRYLCRRFLFFMILLYRWLPGGSVKKIPITLYHRSLNSWRTRDDIFKKILYFVMLSSINCRRTRCIDHQQQQSVASAILATTQRRVRNTTATLITTPTFRNASTLICGDEYTWNYCGIFIMRSWKMDGGSWTNIYGTTLWRGDEKDWQNIKLFLVLQFLKATTFVVFVFYFFLRSGLFCCVLVPGTLALQLLNTLIISDCLVYSVSQYVTT